MPLDDEAVLDDGVEVVAELAPLVDGFFMSVVDDLFMSVDGLLLSDAAGGVEGVVLVLGFD
jgi:hypothetical protein